MSGFYEPVPLELPPRAREAYEALRRRARVDWAALDVQDPSQVAQSPRDQHY